MVTEFKKHPANFNFYSYSEHEDEQNVGRFIPKFLSKNLNRGIDNQREGFRELKNLDTTGMLGTASMRSFQYLLNSIQTLLNRQSLLAILEADHFGP